MNGARHVLNNIRRLRSLEELGWKFGELAGWFFIQPPKSFIDYYGFVAGYYIPVRSDSLDAALAIAEALVEMHQALRLAQPVKK